MCPVSIASESPARGKPRSQLSCPRCPVPGDPLLAVGTPQQPPGRCMAGAECDILGSPGHHQHCPSQQDTATSRSCGLSPELNLLSLWLGLKGPETDPALQGHSQCLPEGVKHPELPSPDSSKAALQQHHLHHGDHGEIPL